MSKLKREAMGQYNYVAPTPVPDKGARRHVKHTYPDFYPHSDVTVEIVDPKTFKLSDIQPPKMFDTSYFNDYRHPPVENFVVVQSKNNQNDSKYTAYLQTTQKPSNGKSQTNLATTEKQSSTKSASVDKHNQTSFPERNTIKSAGNAALRQRSKGSRSPPGVARAHSAQPKQRQTTEEKVNTEFYRSLLKARSGSEWKRPPDVSYDVLNPEKPSLKRDTKPYGSQLERDQEKISNTFGEKVRPSRPSTTKSKAQGEKNKSQPTSPLPTAVVSPPVVKRIGTSQATVEEPPSRASTASGRTGSRYSHNMDGLKPVQNRPASCSSSVSTIGEDYLLETGRRQNEVLETIQEDELLDQLQPPSPTSPKPRVMTEPKKRRSKLKKPLPPSDLFTKKGPDARFYASKKNLRTPNEMERFRKARGRMFMRNVEQAIPELDYKDHEVKYQPERQLFQDVRWKVRKDVKDVRDKNLHSLVDRFEQRHQIIKDETRTRLGDGTYIGRNPVSIYKLQEQTNKVRDGQPRVGLQIKYPLHNRRRVTPSLGSVQRARNLGSHAQIFNQPCAPPYWGPQKVDHSLFLPAMAQGI